MYNCGVRHFGSCDVIILSRFSLLLVRIIMHMVCIVSQAVLIRVPAQEQNAKGKISSSWFMRCLQITVSHSACNVHSAPQFCSHVAVALLSGWNLFISSQTGTDRNLAQSYHYPWLFLRKPCPYNRLTAIFFTVWHQWILYKNIRWRKVLLLRSIPYGGSLRPTVVTSS
jgi:hypothetical protein